MAIGKKTTTARKRKPGAKKAGAKKKKARVSASPDKVKIAGSGIFAKTSCHSTKAAAQKQAGSVRRQKNKARVIKTGGTYCVYKGGKIKANAPILRRKRA